jgi:hypothetical protein
MMKRGNFTTPLIIIMFMLVFLGMRIADAYTPLPDAYAHLEKIQQLDTDLELNTSRNLAKHGHDTQSLANALSQLPASVALTWILEPSYHLCHPGNLSRTHLPSRASPV